MIIIMIYEKLLKVKCSVIQKSPEYLEQASDRGQFKISKVQNNGALYTYFCLNRRKELVSKESVVLR